MNEIKTELYKIVRIRTGPLATNCYVVFDNLKNAAIVDFAFCDDKIVHIFKNENLKLKFVLLTHGHFDHFMGLENGFDLLKQKCSVFISELDFELATDSYKNASKLMGFDFKLNSNNLQTFKEQADFKLNSNVVFKALSCPGHTKGCCSFVLNDEVLFSGDSLFKNSSGRTDLFSGNFAEASKTLDFFKTLNPNLKILPGHGPSTTLEQELLNSPVFN